MLSENALTFENNSAEPLESCEEPTQYLSLGVRVFKCPKMPIRSKHP